MVTDVLGGQYRSVFKGQGMEFNEVREYVPGDDIRAIDWNVTARTGHPFIKKFVEERQLTVMLVVDISASHTFGSTQQLKKNLAAEIAAVLAFSAINNSDRVGLILFTDKVERFVPPQKGTRHVLRVIREILYFQPEETKTKLEPALDYLNHITTHRTVTFLISDFLYPLDNYQHMLLTTAKRHDLISIIIGDKLEFSWPKAGLVDWEDSETGRRFVIDTSDAATRERFSQLQISQRKELLAFLRRRGIDTVEVFAGEPYEKELIKFFKMRERRLK